MSKVNIVPKATTKRYPVYLKALRKLQSQGVKRVKSEELSAVVDITPTTIRRDLSLIGCLGRQGYGYDVEYLIDVFSEELGNNIEEKIVLIGVGNLGSALLNYNRWQYVAGEIIMGFDVNPDVVNTTKLGIPIYHIDELEKRLPKNCHLAILTASSNGQEIVDRLLKCGIIGIVDFTHQHIQTPKGVILKHLDIVTSIQELIFETNIIKKLKQR